MLVGVLDTDTFEFRYASAGHDPAFVRTAYACSSSSTCTGRRPRRHGIGAFDTRKTLALQPGDTLVLATDGLTEARDREGDRCSSRAQWR